MHAPRRDVAFKCRRAMNAPRHWNINLTLSEDHKFFLIHLLVFTQIKMFIEIQTCIDNFASDLSVKVSTLLTDEIWWFKNSLLILINVLCYIHFFITEKCFWENGYQRLKWTFFWSFYSRNNMKSKKFEIIFMTGWLHVRWQMKIANVDHHILKESFLC
jgi:hypothetical protein